MIVLLSFLIGMVLSAVASILLGATNVFALLSYIILGVIVGAISWNYSEYVLFPATTFILIFFSLYSILFNAEIFPEILSALFSFIVFSSAIAFVASIKYLLSINP